MKPNTFWGTVLDLIFPPRCVCCGRVASPGQQVCAACGGSTPPAFWVGRMVHLQTGNTFLCMAPDVYGGNHRKAMIRFKFYGQRKSARYFAERMLHQLQAEEVLEQIDAIACVPLSAQRLQHRGYNQSQLLAQELCRLTKIPYVEALEKVADNREQHKLHRADRQQNVLGVYAVKNAQAVQGKRLLLVDDIMTTGATLQECAAQLVLAGAGQILCAVAARVPLEEVPS